MNISKYHNALATMYPCEASIVDGCKTPSIEIPIGASIYFYVISGNLSFKDLKVSEGFVGSISHIDAKNIKLENDCSIWFVIRYGFTACLTLTKPEIKGRLSYIDGCSDSLLIYPPRKGDGSLNLLYFPENINQSYHTHPSIRLGYVLSGSGVANIHKNNATINISLNQGDSFMLTEHELHRFTTDNQEMRILAYHPDGDWGPEDHNHTMLNRTYLK